MDEQQLLVSEGNSLEGQVDCDDASSTEGGREGRGRGRGRDGGGGGGGGCADGHGWKPLHFGLPFVIGAEGSYSFRMSKDFVLQRFFYEENKTQQERKFKKHRKSQVTFHNVIVHVCVRH